MNKVLRDKLKTLPNQPGVYFHKDSNGEIIYIGKAKSLKNRVRSYFQKNLLDLKTQKLVKEIADTDWREVETELDALFLEAELVKRYMPRFNILLRDDKSVTYVRINLKDETPYVSLVKSPLDDGAQYIGPFFASRPVKTALRVLRHAFPYYTAKNPSKSMLNKNLGLEPIANDEKYRHDLHKLISYLKGNRKAILRDTEREMKSAAKAKDFEKATALRNQLFALRNLETRPIFSSEESIDISKDRALADLAKILNLSRPPRRIEAYDISHTGGQNVVGSMVVFINGLPEKTNYRKFKISKNKNDDVAALKEVLTRRFSGRHKSWPAPDLILIDGGEPQVNTVSEVLAPLQISYLGIAKKNEEIVYQNRRIVLHSQVHTSGHARNLIGARGSHDDVVKLFQRIRDEAHRFAITYHTSLRAKNMLK